MKCTLRGAFLMHKKTRIEGGEVAGYENIRGANSKRAPGIGKKSGSGKWQGKTQEGRLPEDLKPAAYCRNR